MSYAGANDIKLTLNTAEGRTGWCWLGQPASMIWDNDGDDETFSAEFEFMSLDGKDVQDSHTIDGDDWRMLEETGDLDKVLYWARRGISLEDAIEAAMDGSDPGKVDGELHGDIDKLVTTLRAIVEAVRAEPFATQVRIGLDRADSLLACYAGRE